jgi:uncharacterized membrane protein
MTGKSKAIIFEIPLALQGFGVLVVAQNIYNKLRFQTS